MAPSDSLRPRCLTIPNSLCVSGTLLLMAVLRVTSQFEVAVALCHSHSLMTRLVVQGHHMPEHYNPAEFIADIIAVDPSSLAAEQASR